MRKRVHITLDETQIAWIKQHDIALSKWIRRVINERMGISPTFDEVIGHAVKLE